MLLRPSACTPRSGAVSPPHLPHSHPSLLSTFPIFVPGFSRCSSLVVLSTYGLSTLEPKVYEDLHTGETVFSTAGPAPDPLGLLPSLPPGLPSTTHVGSAKFDPKVFLAVAHADIAFDALTTGRAHLNASLEETSGALKKLVSTEWDRFVTVKAATEAVSEELREGPFADDELGAAPLSRALDNALASATAVYEPIIDARMKADRLKSTLGVFQRGKFFFNLPGTISGALTRGRYDVALQAYQKGRYLLAHSPPDQVLGVAPATSADERARQQRIIETVWSHVEAGIADLKRTLTARLRSRSPADAERLFGLLLQLDPASDPVAEYLEVQHAGIVGMLHRGHERLRRACEDAGEGSGSIATAPSSEELLVFVRACASGDSASPEASADTAPENAPASPLQHVHELTQAYARELLSKLPPFYSVCRNYIDRKYGVTAAPSAPVSGMMTEIIATLTKDLTDVFSALRVASTVVSRDLVLILNELTELANELIALSLPPSPTRNLRDCVRQLQTMFVRLFCTAWVADIKQFYTFEKWEIEPSEPSTTITVRLMVAFERHCAETACKLVPTEVPQDLAIIIKSALFDSLYAFLDGLVQVAFESAPATATDSTDPKQQHIILALSNISHLKQTQIRPLVTHFESTLRLDLSSDLDMLFGVLNQLDAVLFDNYVNAHQKELSEILAGGILKSGIDWYRIGRPKEVHSYIYHAILSLVLVHAEVTTTAKHLVPRMITALVEKVAVICSDCFGRVGKLGVGGMLQATLEIEFVHQTLSMYVSEKADETFQGVYRTISQAYDNKQDENLQAELEELKKLLVASRRATALQFLCFRKAAAST